VHDEQAEGTSRGAADGPCDHLAVTSSPAAAPPAATRSHASRRVFLCDLHGRYPGLGCCRWGNAGIVISKAESAEAIRQASSYLWVADVAGKRGLPIIQSLYSFAARQMVAFTKDGEEWHVHAAAAAAHDATEMHDLLVARTCPAGTIGRRGMQLKW
jgi:hypothetical protein